MTQPIPTLVRYGYSEQDVWRRALGDSAPLRPFALLGECLDAPDVLPAGAMETSNYGPMQQVAFRGAA